MGPESIEDIQRGRSWMPAAMTAAFVVGASIAGWFVFREELEEWFRLEDLAWQPTVGERLTLAQKDRVRTVVTGEVDRLVDSDTRWALVPTSAARVPGGVASWTQTLQSGGWEVRDGDVVAASSLLVAPDPTVPLVAPLPPHPSVPRVDALLDGLVAIDAGVTFDAAGSVATSAASPEALEAIVTRRTGKTLEDRTSLDPIATDALYADLEVLAQRAAFDASACLGGDLYRPGQSWTREVSLTIGVWGPQVLRVEVEHQGYDGDIATLSGQIQRRPSEAALSAEDGLSGLKGTIECRFDVAGKRVVAGRYALEARGKADRKFATLTIDHAWALAGPTQTATIPADFDLAALPPAAAPVEPPAP